MGRIHRGDVGATVAHLSDDELLTSPLGQSPEDGHNSATAGGSFVPHPTTPEETPMTMPANRQRDRQNFQDLAKLATTGLTPPPMSVAPSGVQRAVESTKDDSGIVDLAAASTADPQAALRAQTTPLASQGLFDEDSAHFNASPMSAPPGAVFGGYGSPMQPMQPVPSMPPAPVSVAPASAPAAPPSLDAFASAPFTASPMSSQALPLPTKKKSGAAVYALLGVVALGAAAGGFFYVKSHKASVEATAALSAKAPVAVAKAEAPKPVEPAPAPVAAAPAEPEPVAEPVAEAAPAAPAKAGKVAVAAKPGKWTPPPAKGAPAAKADGPAEVTAKELAAAPSGPAGDLGKAMKDEVGDRPVTPAAGGPTNAPVGNVPQKPSQGAVTGALGAVMPGARACLGLDDAISKAAVVFTSAGTVQSVNVTGSAAGKPAEACIKNALMKAKVQPFAEPTYTAPVTIRHN